MEASQAIQNRETVKYTVNPIETILENTVAMHAQNNLKDLVVTTVNKSNIIAVESSIKPKMGMSSTIVAATLELAESIIDEYTMLK